MIKIDTLTVETEGEITNKYMKRYTDKCLLEDEKISLTILFNKYLYNYMARVMFLKLKNRDS